MKKKIFRKDGTRFDCVFKLNKKNYNDESERITLLRANENRYSKKKNKQTNMCSVFSLRSKVIFYEMQKLEFDEVSHLRKLFSN